MIIYIIYIQYTCRISPKKTQHLSPGREPFSLDSNLGGSTCFLGNRTAPTGKCSVHPDLNHWITAAVVSRGSGVFKGPCKIHPGRLIWNIQITLIDSWDMESRIVNGEWFMHGGGLLSFLGVGLNPNKSPRKFSNSKQHSEILLRSVERFQELWYLAAFVLKLLKDLGRSNRGHLLPTQTMH